MLLTFVRHAEATFNAPTDFERELTAHGHQQANQLGAFFAKIKHPPQLLLSSPVVRARQTAEAIHHKLQSVTFLEQDWLACGMDPEVCLHELRAFPKFKNILLVGHEPDFSSTIAVCLGNPNAGNVAVRKASVCALEIQSLSVGKAILQYFLPPDLLMF